MKKPFFFVKSLISVSLTAVLAGCSLAPGMHYEEEGVLKEFNSSDATKEVESRVELVRLTPKTVQLQEQVEAKLPAELAAYKPDDYRIGIHDAIQIVVWDHPEITVPAAGVTATGTNSRIVKNDGKVFLPYAGELKIAGKTVSEARKLIAARLARFVESPQLDVTVVDYASQHFSVNGEVGKPGRQVITAKPINLLDGIGLAGGFTDISDRRSVSLVRDGKRYQMDMIALAAQGVDLANIYLKDGDTLFVSDNTDHKAYVIGEVNRPRAVGFSYKGLTLTDALGEVGGVSQLFSDASDVYVVRSADALGRKAKVFHLDAASPVALVVADKFSLRPRDVVFVGASDITRWNRVISQLLPSLNIVDKSNDITNN